MAKTYSNAAALRQALETRLRTVAEQRGVQIQGLRLKLSIERLLGPPPASWAEDIPSMASEAGLSAKNLVVLFEILNAYWTQHALGSA